MFWLVDTHETRSNVPADVTRAGFTMGQMGQLPRAPTKIGGPTKRIEKVMFIFMNILFFRPNFEWNLNTSKHI